MITFISGVFSINYHANRGFTLIELAIGMVLVGMVLVAVVAFFEAEKKERRIERKQQITRDVHKAVHAFMTRPQPDAYVELVDGPNGPPADPAVMPPPAYRFPCPADPALGIGDANFGIEMTTGSADGLPPNDDDPSNSTLACDPALETAPMSNIFVGVLPVATLGLGGEQAFDINGNMMTYAVSGNMAQWGAALDKTQAGLITVIDEAGNPNNAPYVIVGHGDDQRGAITRNGVVSGTGPCRGGTTPMIDLGAGDAENCDGDEFFRVATPRTIEGNPDFFDDQISYRMEEVLDADDIHWNLDLATNDIFNTNSGDVRLSSSDFVIGGDDVDGDSPVTINMSGGGDTPAVELQTDGARNGGIAYDFGTDTVSMDAQTGVVTLRAQGTDTLTVTNTGAVITGDATVSGTAGLGGAPAIADTNLNLAGTAKFGDGLCNGATEGAIRYASAADRMEYCDSTGAWMPIGGAGETGDGRWYRAALQNFPTSTWTPIVYDTVAYDNLMKGTFSTATGAYTVGADPVRILAITAVKVVTMPVDHSIILGIRVNGSLVASTDILLHDDTGPEDRQQHVSVPLSLSPGDVVNVSILSCCASNMNIGGSQETFFGIVELN